MEKQTDDYLVARLDNSPASYALPDEIPVEIDNGCHNGYMFCPDCKRKVFSFSLNYFLHEKNCPNRNPKNDARGCTYYCAQEEYDRIILYRENKTTDRD